MMNIDKGCISRDKDKLNLQQQFQETEMSDDTKQNWEIRGDMLHFREEERIQTVSAYDTISNVIGYATELERIV